MMKKKSFLYKNVAVIKCVLKYLRSTAPVAPTPVDMHGGRNVVLVCRADLLPFVLDCDL